MQHASKWRTPATNPQAALVPLVGTEWLLNEMQGKQLVHDSVVTATFGEDNLVQGASGCNDYSTLYRTDGDAMEIDPDIHSTLEECEEAIMAVESLYLASLQKVKSFEIEAEVLFMRDGDGAVTLVYGASSE